MAAGGDLARIGAFDLFLEARGSSGSYEPRPGVSCGKKGSAFCELVVPKAGRILLVLETDFWASM